MKKLLDTKAGKILEAWRKWKSIPKTDKSKSRKVAEFEKRLSRYIDRTLKTTWRPFKDQFDDGQTKKKQAVIQLINVTMNGQKKMYTRWHSITEKTRLMK